MRSITYICDVCKQSKSNVDLSKIKISTEGISIKDSVYSGIQIDICNDCLKKKGFAIEPKAETLGQDKARNTKTLEDKIYEILKDIGVAFTE